MTTKKSKKVIDKKLCVECGKEGSVMHRTFKKRICGTCLDLDKYTLICKSTAKKDYFLNDKDLKDVKCYEVKNPHYSCASAMQLFSKTNIIKTFEEKYDIDDDDEFDEKMEELEQKKLIRSKNKQHVKDERKTKLIKELKKVKVELREDSELCKRYISGTLDKKVWTLESIVNRMCEMKYLFDYANIKSYMKKAKNIKYGEYDEYDERSLVDIAEELVLEKIGKYPTKWPWLH